MNKKTKCYCGHTDYCDCGPLEEPKQETLEEAAERYSLELLETKTIEPHEKTWIKSIFIHIAKYQAERMYSEEDLKEAFIEGHNVCRCVTDNTDEAKECFNEWFKNNIK